MRSLDCACPFLCQIVANIYPASEWVYYLNSASNQHQIVSHTSSTRLSRATFRWTFTVMMRNRWNLRLLIEELNTSKCGSYSTQCIPSNYGTPQGHMQTVCNQSTVAALYFADDCIKSVQLETKLNTFRGLRFMSLSVMYVTPLVLCVFQSSLSLCATYCPLITTPSCSMLPTPRRIAARRRTRPTRTPPFQSLMTPQDNCA